MFHKVQYSNMYVIRKATFSNLFSKAEISITTTTTIQKHINYMDNLFFENTNFTKTLIVGILVANILPFTKCISFTFVLCNFIGLAHETK